MEKKIIFVGYDALDRAALAKMIFPTQTRTYFWTPNSFSVARRVKNTSWFGRDLGKRRRIHARFSFSIFIFRRFVKRSFPIIRTTGTILTFIAGGEGWAAGEREQAVNRRKNKQY